MTPDDDPTNASRRGVLRTAGAALTALVGVGGGGTGAATPGKGEQGNGTEFGRVYANGDLWRTNVVEVLEEEPEPNDDIYFLHDGSKRIDEVGDASDEQQSPFVSESAPGDRDWNGGQWVHYSAEVTDVEAFNEDAPLDASGEFVGAEPTASTKGYIGITKGRPGFGPPNYFVCPLNGRA